MAGNIMTSFHMFVLKSAYSWPKYKFQTILKYYLYSIILDVEIWFL